MSESINSIKQAFQEADSEKRKKLILQYQTDSRRGVLQLVEKARKREEDEKKELARLEAMKQFELKYERYQAICGIDEAGRGPFAGPVVAGAVILPKDVTILYLNDSKQIRPALREQLYDEIVEKAVAYGIGIVSQDRIDEINILQATFEAMRKAINQLSVTPDLLLVDAETIPQVSQKQVGIVKGDARSVSIAAASILAKVTRDRLMVEYDQIYPEYGFAKHKGYGTAAHIEAIQSFGPCPIHRRSFIKNYL